MRSKQVPATTNNITLGIINFLNSKGHFAFRVNTTGIYDPVNRIFRKPMKESKGCPDILCCLRFDGGYEETTHGQFLGIEIKNKLTKDRMSNNQKEFHKKLESSNGQILIVHSYKQFLDWWKESTEYHPMFYTPE